LVLRLANFNLALRLAPVFDDGKAQGIHRETVSVIR
jgi:hypothetical protein